MPSPSTLTNTVEKEMQDFGQASLSVQQQCSAAEVERRAIAMLFRRNRISTKLGNMECAEPTNTAAPPAQLRSPQYAADLRRLKRGGLLLFSSHPPKWS